MRRLALFAALALVACSPYGSTNPDGPPKYTRTVISDEFNTFDTRVWSTGKFGQSGVTPPYNSRETACYSPANVTVDGYLHLRYTDPATTPCGKPYLGASISTYRKIDLRPPVVIEARVCLNGGAGGIYNWPAFWTVGSGLDWPRLGEIDIMEGLGGRARGTYHDADGTQTFAEMGRTVGCHVYAIWWRDHRVTEFLDGHRFGIDATGVVDDPQDLILGAQGSGDIGGDDRYPDEVRVDWLHAFVP